MFAWVMARTLTSGWIQQLDGGGLTSRCSGRPGAAVDRPVRRRGILSAEVTWHHLIVWPERNGWLIFPGNGFPMMLFPVGARRLLVCMRRCAELPGVCSGR